MSTSKCYHIVYIFPSFSINLTLLFSLLFKELYLHLCYLIIVIEPISNNLNQHEMAYKG